MMTSDDVREVLDHLEAAGIPVWLDGGWGVDALVGRQSRPHDDLDLVIPREQLSRAQELLTQLGFQHAANITPGLPARLVLRAPNDRQIDFHPVVFDSAGNGQQELGDGTWGTYPAGGLIGSGQVAGRGVRCITAELQLRHHLGYEPGADDRQDMRLLSEHFGLTLPPPYSQPAPKA